MKRVSIQLQLLLFNIDILHVVTSLCVCFMCGIANPSPHGDFDITSESLDEYEKSSDTPYSDEERITSEEVFEGASIAIGLIAYLRV